MASRRKAKVLLAEYPHTLFWITNCQMIDPVTWEAILSYFGNGHEKEPPPVPQSRSRLFFQCTATPEEVISSAWAKRIPIIAYMPCFEDRSLEDREALAVKAFFKESNNIGKQVLVSSVVLHELASRSYSDGLVGLEASMSRKLLIATHGYLANGFKSSIEVLVGTSVGIDTINAYTEEGGEDYTKSITRFLESVGPEDEGVILTDIVGGSVNQKVLQTLHRNEPNIFIISGTNLITALAVYLEDRPLTKDVVKEIVDQAKVQLIELPTSFESGSDEEDDFF